MSERLLQGLAASPGVAVGAARVLDAADDGAAPPLPADQRPAEAERALRALAAAADQIRRVASELTVAGSTAEAEIVETGVLMAADPGLAEAISVAAVEGGLSAGAAIRRATARYAEMLAAVDDDVLSLRADDVRSLGRRAAAIADGETESPPAAGGAFILVARELGPADVAELGSAALGVALAAGGVMAHAAIVARSLGIPMVVGLGDEVLGVASGAPLVVDGGDGSVALAPGRARRRSAQVAAARRLRARERAAAARALPAETSDGHRVRVLVNVASPTEVGVGLGAGAEGVGLFRTELRFLDASDWPTEEQHRRQLAPVLGCLEGVTATVRLLDFGGDKTPPFLDGTHERGVGLLLCQPDALAAQLAAIVDVGAHTDLRILLPMVEDEGQVETVRALLRELGAGETQVGAMIESVGAVERAREIAAAADFLSIGTNDLTHSVLSTDRFAPGTAGAHHPIVLRAIAETVAAASAHGRLVEVCGEAAGDAQVMPLLLGLDVGELSVGAARVGSVRAWVRALGYGSVADLARQALELSGAREVVELVRPVAELLGQLDYAAAEGIERGAGIVAVGRQR